MIDVVNHFDLQSVSGVRLDMSIPILYEGETLHQDVQVPWFDKNDLLSSIDFGNGKMYRIDFTIDLDEYIYVEGGVLKMIPKFAPTISEL